MRATSRRSRSRSGPERVGRATRLELPPEKPVATVEVAQDVGESSNGPTSQLAADDNLDGSRRVGQPSPEQQQQTEHESEGVEKVPGALYDAYGNLILARTVLVAANDVWFVRPARPSDPERADGMRASTLAYWRRPF